MKNNAVVLLIVACLTAAMLAIDLGLFITQWVLIFISIGLFFIWRKQCL